MIQLLPVEISECIYNRLCVFDRIKYWMARPEGSRSKMKCKSRRDEKSLGVLASAIKKKKVHTLSVAMLNFLKGCDEGDPTVKEILTELALKPCDIFDTGIQMSLDLFKTKAANGSLSKDDIEAFTKGLKTCGHQDTHHFERVVYISHPSAFKLLFDDDCFFKGIITRIHQSSLMFNIFNYINEGLVEFIYNGEGKSLLQWDWAHNKRTIMGIPSMFSYAPKRQLIFKYIDFTMDELNALWTHAINAMNIDCALDIEKKIKDKESQH